MIWDLRPANLRNNDAAPPNLPNTPTDENDNDSAADSATEESTEDVPNANITDDLIIIDDGVSKNIRRVDHTFLLGYGLKAGYKPNVKNHLELRNLDRNIAEFKKMQKKFRYVAKGDAATIKSIFKTK